MLRLDPDRSCFAPVIPTVPPCWEVRDRLANGLTHGSTYKIAAEQVISADFFAADALEVSGEDVEFRDGRYFVKGTDRAISFAEVMQQCSSQVPHPLDTVAEMPIVRAFPSGAHVAEIEIDRETGWATVVGYTAVDDIGNVINQVLADGQLHGASCRERDRSLARTVFMMKAVASSWRAA
jgi:CO/xanthine dehydrogenase Mo-binding subunit